VAHSKKMKMKPMLLTLFLCCPLFGQELDTKVLSGFYNKVIIDFLEGELERDTLNEQRHYVIKTDLEKNFFNQGLCGIRDYLYWNK
jgi:hypothetical protein